MSADLKVRTALNYFETLHGVRPNAINMGYRLADELLMQFYSNTIPVRNLEAEVEKRNLEVRYEYEGIPVKIDYNNPDLLEVGYMVKWLENKY